MIKKCKTCGDEFPQYNTIQNECVPCLMKSISARKRLKHKRLKDIVKPDKLQRKADGLYQKKLKVIYPYSILSGEPTQAIHHFIYKSHSNNLRYDLENGIPLTIVEHRAIHESTSRSAMELEICLKKGEDWQNLLLEKSKIITKLSVPYLEEVIKKLENGNE